MGHPVRTIYEDCLEEAVPRRLFICPCSATRTVLVLSADERRGIFRVEPGADLYTLSAAVKSTLRDSHRLVRKSDNRQASVRGRTSEDSNPITNPHEGWSVNVLETKKRTRGEYDGTRYERVTWFDPEPAGGYLLCVRGRRRSGRGPFQLRAVWVEDQLSTRSKGPDSFEVAGYIQATLLGRAVGHPVRVPDGGRLAILMPRRLCC